MLSYGRRREAEKGIWGHLGFLFAAFLRAFAPPGASGSPRGPEIYFPKNAKIFGVPKKGLFWLFLAKKWPILAIFAPIS